MSATSFTFEPVFLALPAAVIRAVARGHQKYFCVQKSEDELLPHYIAVANTANDPARIAKGNDRVMRARLADDIAPPLILLGLTPAMRSWLDAHGALRLRARYALPAWLAAWYGTHLAGFYDWALRSEWPLNVEHALLIAGGLLFWWPLVSGRLAPPAAVAYLGAGFVASSFLGLALIFSSRPFYSFYEHTQRLWGLSPIRDQNLGGIVMNGEQTLVFLLAIGWYVWRLLDEEHAGAAGDTPAAR